MLLRCDDCSRVVTPAVATALRRAMQHHDGQALQHSTTLQSGGCKGISCCDLCVVLHAGQCWRLLSQDKRALGVGGLTRHKAGGWGGGGHQGNHWSQPTHSLLDNSFTNLCFSLFPVSLLHLGQHHGGAPSHNLVTTRVLLFATSLLHSPNHRVRKKLPAIFCLPSYSLALRWRSTLLTC